MLRGEMKGKTCIVTGSSSGIGKETAVGLASLGATVVMAVRNEQRGEKAETETITRSGNQQVKVMICDLSSVESIRTFVEEFRRRFDRLDVLVNNAGALFSKRGNTIDGFERTLATNYLGPRLLTNELLPSLKSGAPSRVINVGSGLHWSGKLDFDDLQFEKHYNASKAYANAKLMLTMWTYDLAGRVRGTGITVNVTEPGFVATNLGKNSGSLILAVAFTLMRPFQISAEKGAENSVYLAYAPDIKGVSGKCFSKKRETKTAPISYDLRSQRLLWDATEDLLAKAVGPLRN